MYQVYCDGQLIHDPRLQAGLLPLPCTRITRDTA